MAVDARVMNHMDPDTRLAHIRLEQWGKICADRWAPWPRSTLLGKVIEFGLSGAAQAGRPVEAIPEEVAQTDGAVARLSVIDRRAVTTYYTRSESVEVCARRCGMRVRQFQNVLKRARWRIAYFLQDERLTTS